MAITRIFDLLRNYSEKYQKPDALSSKVDGAWKSYSTNDFIERANLTSLGLLQLGIKKGDKIATISNNRPEWNFLDFGMQQVGAVHVPIYPTISDHDLEFILEDAEITYIVVSSRELYEKVKPLALKITSIKEVFTFNMVDGARNYNEIIELGKTTQEHQKLDMIKATIKPDDLVTLLYTSGTTGNPKGVMLSHANLVSNFIGVRNLAPFHSSWRALSFLPINHVYERMLTYLYMYLGISIYYAESLETIVDNLKEVKPHIFATVPRLLEKVYDKIVAKGSELTGIKKQLFFWALNLGLRYDNTEDKGFWYNIQLKLANKLIFTKWREALGGNVQAVVSGGAALQPRLARVFWAANIPVLEGYGLTETSPVIAVNNFNENGLRFGTVGPVIEKVQVRIAEDGEILVKGPNVMLGYYNRPDATAEVIDAEGWFHTGDIGTFEENRFLKITDRKKEIFKTSGGKYIAPQMIENKLKESPFIEQAIVLGENQKFASALIVPAFLFIKEWSQKKNIRLNTNEDIVLNEAVQARIKEEIQKVNKQLGSYEQVKRFELVPGEWSIAGGEMTPKLSIKRKIVIEKYKSLIDKIYGN